METKKTTENINEAKNFSLKRETKLINHQLHSSKKQTNRKDRERAQMNKADIKEKLPLIPKKYKGL